MEGGDSLRKMEGTADNRDNAQRFLKDYPMSDAVFSLRELISHIHSRWKAVKCPPDLRKVVRRTSEIIACILPPDHYEHERERKFLSVENCGPFSVPWKPYAELGAIELNTTNLVLNNLVSTLALEEKTSRDSLVDSTQPKVKKAPKDVARIPTFIYPFPEEDQFDELTAYDLIKESLNFITEISEDLKNPKRNLQEIIQRKMKEYQASQDGKGKEMVFIPFKPVDHMAAQDIIEAEVGKFSRKLNAIMDIINILLNLEDEDILSKFPLRRLAMVRLKRSKDVGISKVPRRLSLEQTDATNALREDEAETARKFFGRPEPIWQNKYKVTGVRHFGNEHVRFEPHDFVNQLRGVLIRSTEKIRSAGTYLLKRLEADFDRRYKYTSLALSSLPLILIQQSEIAHYAEYLKSIVDKAAYANGNRDILKSDKDLSLYLLGDLEELFADMVEIALQEREEYSQELPRAVWYLMLENEADEMGILKEPRIQGLLKQIYEIHSANLSKVKHIQEKFCMIVTSAPMEDVCSKAWQTAAKFIHEYIMESPEGMIDYWLAERGIPIHSASRPTARKASGRH